MQSYMLMNKYIYQLQIHIRDIRIEKGNISINVDTKIFLSSSKSGVF